MIHVAVFGAVAGDSHLTSFWGHVIVAKANRITTLYKSLDRANDVYKPCIGIKKAYTALLQG